MDAAGAMGSCTQKLEKSPCESSKSSCNATPVMLALHIGQVGRPAGRCALSLASSPSCQL